MLVLGRKKGERIILIDKDSLEKIVITYLGVDNYGGGIVGVEAGSKYKILREELAEGEIYVNSKL